jgi:16S rRNA G527 N7-methylase RsmG
MDRKELEQKITLLFEVAKELSTSDITVVRQRAEAIVGLLQDLMVTVVRKG